MDEDLRQIRAFLLGSRIATFQRFLNNSSYYQISKNQLIPIDFTKHHVYSACPVASLAIAALFFSSFWRTSKLIGTGQEPSRSVGTKYLRH